MIISIRLYMSLTLWHRQFRNPIFLVLWTCYSEVQLVTSAAVSLLGALRAAWTFASRAVFSKEYDWAVWYEGDAPKTEPSSRGMPPWLSCLIWGGCPHDWAVWYEGDALTGESLARGVTQWLSSLRERDAPMAEQSKWRGCPHGWAV